MRGNDKWLKQGLQPDAASCWLHWLEGSVECVFPVCI